MKPLTFKVSAKAARLLGRENVSNAEAAISELIKNTYDADATACLVCFLPKYLSAPPRLSSDEYTYLYAKDKHIEDFYSKNDDNSVTLRPADPDSQSAAYSIVAQLIDLWIIDNGSGMSSTTIETCWMVIGTNDKELNVISQKGRARTGAKGIGRFALDRLGNRCDLYSSSLSNGRLQSIRWEVDWRDFDGNEKVLDDISARLDQTAKPLGEVLKFLDDYPQLTHAKNQASNEYDDWTTGTAIRIAFLRDNWIERDLNRLNKTLGALIPPIEQKELNLLLFDASRPSSYGFVSGHILEDYDYKLEATITDSDNISFHIYRNELDRENIDAALFQFDEMRSSRFDDDSVLRKEVVYKESLQTLFPEQNKQFFRQARELGPFSIQLLFFKKGRPNRRDAEIYPYRPFHPGPRKAWLDEFGGIKIYRDHFAVRPYGEQEGRAFDWLALGQRVAISPVAASRKGWKVSPQNLAGTVMISRAANVRLYDQTNREGIIENEHFAVFRALILKVIQEFEDDRSHIHYNLNELYKQKNQSEAAKDAGAIAATRVVKDPGTATPEDAQKLAKAFVAQQDEIRELRDEQTMLRALATLGTVLVSFSHEMGQLQNTMGSRSAVLADILTSYISADEMGDAAGAFHPYRILDEWAEDDKRVKQWFTFALTSIRAGRRRRRRVSIRDHLRGTKAVWKGFLQPREVVLHIEFEDDEIDAYIMAFQIDLDSIFNNLILNSVEAFLSSRHVGDRRIDVEVQVLEDYVRINYRDSGPGIHPSIRDPAHIFRFGVTTKRGPDGDTNGVGLGMWILGAVVQGYGGTCKAFRQRKQDGFRLELTLPLIEGSK